MDHPERNVPCRQTITRTGQVKVSNRTHMLLVVHHPTIVNIINDRGNFTWSTISGTGSILWCIILSNCEKKFCLFNDKRGKLRKTEGKKQAINPDQR